MPRSTRTGWLDTSQRTQRELAAQLAKHVGIFCAAEAAYPELSARRTRDHRKRVRITILVEPAPAGPAKPRRPRRPRPCQGSLELEVPPGADGTIVQPEADGPRFRVRLFGADGGM